MSYNCIIYQQRSDFIHKNKTWKSQFSFRQCCLIHKLAQNSSLLMHSLFRI